VLCGTSAAVPGHDYWKAKWEIIYDLVNVNRSNVMTFSLKLSPKFIA